MMKSLYISILIIAFCFASCKKEQEDVNCDNAIVNLCNKTTDQIFVYGFNVNRVTDTLFPGECDLRELGPITIKYHRDGSIKESNTKNTTLYNPSQTVSLGITSCYWEYIPDYGYQDISHCYNGTFDPKEREYDVDCGGSCVPCDSVPVPCSSLTEESFILTNRANHFRSPSTYVFNEINNKRIMEFTFNNGDVLNVSIPFNEVPASNKRFIIGSEYWESDVWFTDRWGFNRYTAVDGGSIYFIIDSSGNQSIQFCKVNFTRNSLTAIGSGYLNLDQVIK